MTWAQWLFEYRALLKKDQDRAEMIASTTKTGARVLKEVLVHVLGLNLVYDAKAEAAARERAAAGEQAPEPEYDGTKFIPASFILGRPEALKHYSQEMESERQADKAANDHKFDDFSEALMQSLEGEDVDLGPIGPVIFSAAEKTAQDYWRTEAVIEELEAIGVEVVDEEHDKDVVPSIKGRPQAPQWMRPSSLDVSMVEEAQRQADIAMAEAAKFRQALRDAGVDEDADG